MFEAKLRPCFKSMNEGTNPLPPNTTTPYIIPPVLCFHLFDGEGGGLLQADDTFPTSLVNSLEFDFTATAAHLEAARTLPAQAEALRRRARPVLQPSVPASPALLDLFRTELHAAFLWGERGARSPPLQRFARLTDVLSAMAAKLAARAPDADDAI